jgi:hypothetical protein
MDVNRTPLSFALGVKMNPLTNWPISLAAALLSQN